MRLTQFTDYALRLLIYAAAYSDRLVTIEETAAVYGISRNHLMKVANLLTRHDFLRAVRGRTGGFMLARAPESIGLGHVVRSTEPDFSIVECFRDTYQCSLTPSCRLKGILGTALAAFLNEMDRHTLADLVLDPAQFGIERPAA
ncbi:Rrf2 family transcriptional regulator [Devosia sp.]|uniref:Rrf2 family transcriptional regulator n=1 Tax=Devosia sp. TaxID=1871048 RepID=UPI002734EA83|nr:Rrf2 family transcriptional regulator [Devosia sp.]MDP2780435.1 Rrf2 family transcriptional regulator [Devosia sp.]